MLRQCNYAVEEAVSFHITINDEGNCECVCVCIKFGHCACTMLIGVFNKFKDSSSGSTLVEKLQEKIKELVSGIEYESIRV